MTAERFLTLHDVAEELNISVSQTYALVRSGDLQGIQIGGRNQWRVERVKLEELSSPTPTSAPRRTCGTYRTTSRTTSSGHTSPLVNGI